ncbi:MAG TPA: DUF1097 domain-containing protein [Prolixibacteraceae bacterium]|nr:DUF1097 domain-containing protein [Prolixibacteraceae bacterium]
MDFKKFIVIPVFIAFLAFTFMFVDKFISPFMPIEGNNGFSWVTFQAWAMYFMAGCTIKGGVKTFLGYVMGVLAAVAIIFMAGAFGSAGSWALPLAVFVAVIPMCSMERAHWSLDFVPALFISSAVFFAFTGLYKEATFTAIAITILTYCAIGMIYGVVTVSARAAYEKMVAKTA